MDTPNSSVFGRQREALVAFSEKVAAAIPDRADEVRSGVAHLVQNRFEIGVIGQIKAGKSTFLNALAERPGLLPMDVNPWTAVITRLFFGTEDGANGSAVFRFFDQKEWGSLTGQAPQGGLQRLTQGAERVVEHVVKAVRGGGGEAAQKPQSGLDEAREKLLRRASQRLGDELPRLLGTERRFTEVNAEVLERFLCSGDGAREDKPHAGLYADVTREAELHFPLHPFPDACVVVDTPGTNDPFKARSAVTLRYLASADAYLLLLSAPRALDSQDAQLIDDLLTGLHKERVVVFVNRIDNLNDLRTELPKVMDRVHGWFREKYPKLTIPIIAGSAWWATQAARADKRATQQFLLKEGVREYGLARKAFTAEQFQAWESDPQAHADQVREAMFKLSGLPQARAEVAETLLREKGRLLLQGARGNLRAQLGAYVAEGRSRAEQLTQRATDLEGSADAVKAKLKELEKQLAQRDEDSKSIEHVPQQGQADLQAEVDKALDDVRHGMDMALRRSASAEAKRLLDNGIGVFDDAVWVADAAGIRRGLEEAFKGAYSRARDRLESEQEHLRRKLRRELQGIGETAALELDATPIATIDPSPSLESLGANSAVELGGVVRRFFSGSGTAREKADELAAAVVGEFAPALDGLVGSARRTLEVGLQGTVRGCEGAVKRALKRIDGELKEKREEYEQRLQTENPEDIRAQGAELRRRAAQEQARSEGLGALLAELERWKTPGGVA